MIPKTPASLQRPKRGCAGSHLISPLVSLVKEEQQQEEEEDDEEDDDEKDERRKMKMKMKMNYYCTRQGWSIQIGSDS